MMGFPCVRLAGRFVACFDARAGCLVVKANSPPDRKTRLASLMIASKWSIKWKTPTHGKGWSTPDTQFWTRVNSLDSPWGLDDLTAAVTEIGHHRPRVERVVAHGRRQRDKYHCHVVGQFLIERRNGNAVLLPAPAMAV